MLADQKHALPGVPGKDVFRSHDRITSAVSWRVAAVMLVCVCAWEGKVSFSPTSFRTEYLTLRQFPSDLDLRRQNTSFYDIDKIIILKLKCC